MGGEQSADAGLGARVAAAAVLETPDHHLAPLAALLLLYLPVLAQVESAPSLAWPAEHELAALERSPFQRGATTAVAPAQREATAFLLATQREDGSWASPTEVMNRQVPQRQPLTVATTAWAARALLADAERPAVRAALDRAFDFLAEARQRTRRDGDPFGIMDYTVWSKPCLLLLLADALHAGVVPRDLWQKELEVLVEELLAKQKSGGGFSYYQGSDVTRLDPSVDVSFSFVTAFVLLGLRAARSADVELPVDAVTRALDCLERMRNVDGSFDYSLVHAQEDVPRPPMPAGGAGRGPLCALALQAFGRTDAAEVKRSLDAFLIHRASYSREHGKSVMHCGPEGQGSHYLMFDYAFVAAAIGVLPEGSRTLYRDAILDQLRGARLRNGAYLDNPLLGDRFGAAAGLWALRQL